MRMTPNAGALVDIALETFRSELLPVLPPDRRYAALMVANALSIAERELRIHDEAGQRMLSCLSDLFGEEADPTLRGHQLHERVEALQRRLCADIAAGDYDTPGEARTALLDCLRIMVTARLSIANPKALGAG